MRCHECRTAISARLDGESPGVDVRSVERHLGGCEACRSFAGDAAASHRALRLGPAEPVPDLTPAVLAAIGSAERRPNDRVGVLRVCLVLVAVVQLGASVPALLLGDDPDLPAHAARHAGAFTVALAVGFLVAAWRPDRAAGVVWVAAAVVAFLALSAAADLASGAAMAGDEVSHAPLVVGLLVAWLLTRAAGGGRTRTAFA